MPVYNAEKYLSESIESILSQSFTEYTFLIVDDGSHDGSQEIVKSFSDSRIKFIQNSKNLGVAASLNKAMDDSSSKYIARMDADDLSHPKRLETQIDFMEKNHSIGVCGSWVWNLEKKKKFLLKYPSGTDCIRSFFLFSNPLCHPSVVMRRELLAKYNLKYDTSFRAAQDFDLWRRCSEFFSLENIKVPLLKWRKTSNSVTWNSSGISNQITCEILKSLLVRLGMKPTIDELDFHREVGNGSGARSISELKKMHMWLEKILELNVSAKIYPTEGLREAAAFVWFRTCLNSSCYGLKAINVYLSSYLKRWYRPDTSELFYFYANAMTRWNKHPTGRVSY